MKHVLTIAFAVLASTAMVTADDAKKLDPTCPVSGAKVNMEKASEFNGGKVYFCCGNCKAKFDGGSDKFAAKANHQLVVTGQATQKACPFAGRAANPKKTAEIAGVDVAFCCGNCQGKVAKADDKKKMTLVFSNDAFKKGFEVAAAK